MSARVSVSTRVSESLHVCPCVHLEGDPRVSPQVLASWSFPRPRVSVSDPGPWRGPGRSRPCVSVPLSAHPGVCPSSPSLSPPWLRRVSSVSGKPSLGPPCRGRQCRQGRSPSPEALPGASVRRPAVWTGQVSGARSPPGGLREAAGSVDRAGPRPQKPFLGPPCRGRQCRQVRSPAPEAFVSLRGFAPSL